MLRVIVDGEDMGDFRVGRSAHLFIMSPFHPEQDWEKFCSRWDKVDGLITYASSTKSAIENMIEGKNVQVLWEPER